jgi:hypothetical protein
MHILHTPMTEVSRDPYRDGEERWCFQCRKRRPFELVITEPIVMCWCRIDGPRREDGEGEVVFNSGAYYGPTPQVMCTKCKTVDGDCFPGTYREWGEE